VLAPHECPEGSGSVESTVHRLHIDEGQRALFLWVRKILAITCAMCFDFRGIVSVVSTYTASYIVAFVDNVSLCPIPRRVASPIPFPSSSSQSDALIPLIVATGAQIVLSTRLLLNLREGYYREINGTTTEWGEVNLSGLECTPEQTEAGVVQEGREIGFAMEELTSEETREKHHES
jgi:hypothetical protein